MKQCEAFGAHPLVLRTARVIRARGVTFGINDLSGRVELSKFSPATGAMIVVPLRRGRTIFDFTKSQPPQIWELFFKLRKPPVFHRGAS